VMPNPSPVPAGRKRAFLVGFAVQVILGILILSSGVARGSVVWAVVGGVILVWAATLAVFYRRSTR
jgi:heme A synthase